MPRKVSQIDLRNRSQITNAYQVICTDPTNFGLARVPATQFRGASVFTSENDPTTTPENPLINEYIDGDIYIKDTSEGQLLFIWDSVNGAWKPQNRLNGLRLLSASDFPDETNLDLRDTNFISDIAYENDYYLNKTLDLLFGTYSAATGFKFGTIDFTGYKGFRGPIHHTFQGKDLNGYDDPAFYLDEYLQSAATTKQKLVAKRPIHGDLVHILLENDEGHGGWYYTFNTNLSPTGSTLLENYNLLLGTSVSGDQPLVKQHWREVKTWNETTTPVQNDKKYRQGDNVFNVTKGILFYNYQEGLPENTTDLGLLFEGQTTLSGSSLKTAQDVNGNWIKPAANDSEYTAGDFIFTKEGNTPRIHGPYSFGESTDHGAWPLYSVLRSPLKHRFKYDSSKITDYSSTGEYFPYYNGTMIVDGDTAVDVYVANVADIDDQSVVKKEIERVSGCTVDYTTKLVTWGEGRVHRDPFKIHTSTATGKPSVDLLTYYNGDIVRNKVGTLYRFDEDYVTPASSDFTMLDGLRSSYTHIAETTDNNFIPSTANESTQWGSGSVQDNDYLEVRYTGSSTSKTLLYKAEVNEATNTITWLQRKSAYGQRTFSDSLNQDPVADNQLYTTDDFYTTGDGRKYKYDETANTNAGGWSFVEWTRPVEVFVTEKGNDYSPVVDANDYLDATTKVGVTDKRLKEGDQIFVHVVDTGVRTGKQYYYQVLTENPVTFSEKLNPRVTQYFAEASVTRNNLNDLKYSTGDFLDNPSTGWRYGPYVEGAADNATAWPDFKQLGGDTTVDLKFNPNKEYPQNASVIYEGSVYKANSSMDGTTTPITFVEGTATGEWTLILKGVDDLRNLDNSIKYELKIDSDNDEIYYEEK